MEPVVDGRMARLDARHACFLRPPPVLACRRSRFAARLAGGDPITNPVAVSERSLEGDSPEIARALTYYPEIRMPRVARIERGLIHQTFLVEDSEDRYVLQRLSPVFSPDVHENIAAVTQCLALHGITTPRLCRTEAGALYADLAETGCWRLMTYVPGVAFDKCPSASHARAAATLVGRFHSALDGLEHDFRSLGFAFHDAVRHFRDLDVAIASHRDHPLHGAVSAVAAAIRDAATAWEPLVGLPDRVVHLDLKFNNVLFESREEGEPVAASLIDLDTLSRRPFWVELGDLWRSWCNRQREHESEAALDPEIFEASAEAWLGALTIDLGREELRSLAHGIERLSLELCARFAADALEERYFGWNRELFETAGAHNLARARGQLSLHRQARETREDRLHFLLG